MNTENFSEELMVIEGVQIKLIMYKIGGGFHCHVHNLDPGAVIARSSSSNPESARENALKKTTERLIKYSRK